MQDLKLCQSRMSANGGDKEPQSFRPFTKNERIQQLNLIDKSVTKLLQSAGLAIKTLTASQAQSDADAPLPKDPREAFQATSNSYLNVLQSVDVMLRRQTYGLEEANIIPADKIRAKGKIDGQDPFSAPVTGKPGSSAPVPTDPAAVEGGMGKLDIGWLNTRSGRVGRDMEAELWSRARGFLEGLEQVKTHQKELEKSVHNDSDEDMGS